MQDAELPHSAGFGPAEGPPACLPVLSLSAKSLLGNGKLRYGHSSGDTRTSGGWYADVPGVSTSLQWPVEQGEPRLSCPRSPVEFAPLDPGISTCPVQRAAEALRGQQGT